ncbi:DUF6191 domain-containing protein [Streptomyces sp. NPDC048275]|uniref:DUF6191 domain-containing protein n=1 Tax=Streptomyces sp. NPDC048275 TaxID=3155629 RepID=UPI0033F9A6DD
MALTSSRSCSRLPVSRRRHKAWLAVAQASRTPCFSTSSDGSAAEAWGELFHPSQRHVQQEPERQLVLRDDAESGAPPSSVDLDSGKAAIHPMRSPMSRHDAP